MSTVSAEAIPVYSPMMWAGTSSSLAGKVKGSLPEGFTSPESTSAMALPASEPMYQACTMAGTSSTQGMATALPEMLTTMRFSFASARASITWSWP